jgi:hypothetical protein
MPTNDSSQTERIRNKKQRIQAVFRGQSLRSNKTYPSEQFPNNEEGVLQDRQIGQMKYSYLTPDGSRLFRPCC